MAERPHTPTLEADPRLTEIVRLVDVDSARAMALAKEALAAGGDDGLLHAAIGYGLKDQGRFEDAIAAFGQALERDPGNVRLMTQVGLCLLELGRRQEAANVLGVAIRLDPRSAEASFGYGWAAENLGALDQAKSAWERAIQLDPGRADALAGLAGLAARRRDWETARDLSERAIERDPTLADAVLNLARVDIGEKDFAAAERRLDDFIVRPDVKPLSRATAKLLLGDTLDGAERYDEAFAAYADGKADLAAQFAHAFEGGERPAPPEVAHAMMDEFLASPAEAWAPPAHAGAKGPARGHAFLMGFPRSGTTLLEQVIATHPEMETLGERPVMIDAETEFVSRAGGVTRLAGTVSDLLKPFREVYWRRVREFGVDPAGKVFVDKHPLNTMRLPLISKMFPEARILFAVRDPRDVVLSCFRRNFRMSAVNYEFNHLASAARFYDAVMTAGEIYFTRLPLKVLRLRYEDLVADFDGQCRGLCDFLGVEWTATLRAFADTERTIATPSSVQVGRGLYDEGVGQWRRYAQHLEPVLSILAPWVDKFGYAG